MNVRASVRDPHGADSILQMVRYSRSPRQKTHHMSETGSLYFFKKKTYRRKNNKNNNVSICRQKRVHSSLQRRADRPGDEFLLSSSRWFLLITSRRPSGRMLDTMHQFHVFKTGKRRCHPAYGCSKVVKITAFFTDLKSSDPSSNEFHQNSCTAPVQNDGFRFSGPAQGSG